MCGMLQVFCTSLLPMTSLMWSYASHISILQTTKSWTKIWRVNNTKTIVHESKLCNVPQYRLVHTNSPRSIPFTFSSMIWRSVKNAEICSSVNLCSLANLRCVKENMLSVVFIHDESLWTYYLRKDYTTWLVWNPTHWRGESWIGKLEYHLQKQLKWQEEYFVGLDISILPQNNLVGQLPSETQNNYWGTGLLLTSCNKLQTCTIPTSHNIWTWQQPPHITFHREDVDG